VFLLAADDGEKRRLTSPPDGWESDGNPTFSPDGRKLAFVRQRNASTGEVFVLPLPLDEHTNQELIQLTFSNKWIRVPAWNSEGSEIIFSSTGVESDWWLWRVRFAPGGAPERLASLGERSLEPAISRASHRLVYTRFMDRTNTWRLELPTQGGEASPPVRILSSTRQDRNPQYSPDGKRIAFHSTRSDWAEVWVSDSDGSNAHQLTFLRAPMTGSPRWSPDNSRLVFRFQRDRSVRTLYDRRGWRQTAPPDHRRGRRCGRQLVAR
jgi:Tol biopolymer transport system component